MADEPVPTAVLQTNPTVGVTDSPDASLADLLFEANAGMIASVSRSDAVVFYRSGEVTAISSPYGAFLFDSDEVSADGGNPNPDFTS